ncbi:MAG TPA: 16S rRNA (adenine(1518)-N(6)/adenine(1519)-N(6))-dimethyltransferase RsmA [Nitrospiria bacterium]|nr:16S rRNA (adenine(1518)-N(6)/adenine(1519)-N(6))-dimethyltransferase RsmA [Nitrospiria bacterium]
MTLRPKKSLGQHFLIDPNIRAKILDAAELSSEDCVVEIGPGKGFLTEELIKRAGRVVAIEVDRGWYDLLGKRFADASQLQLVHADALDYRYDLLPRGYKIVSNLPYNLSTPILFRLLEERTRIRRMVLMIQREVAERLVSPPGSRRFGALSVSVQFVCETRLAFSVSPNSFRPRPKVSSSVVVLIPRTDPAVQVRDEQFFLHLVRRIFLHRRKSLKNALLMAGTPQAALKEALLESGIDPARRPETLSLLEFARLSDRLFEKTRGL